MNDTRHAYLVAKVKARNIVNQEIKNRVPAMVEALKPFVGQKVCKVDGTLLKKVSEVLPVLPNCNALHCYYEARVYTISVGLRVCLGVDDHACVYQDDSICIGEVQDGVLLKNQRPLDLTHFRTDWTVEEVEKAREDVRKAQEALSEANRPLYHFGMSDH